MNDEIHAFEDIMSSWSNDIGYTKLTEMEMETDPNLPPIVSKTYIPSLMSKEVWKELEDLEKKHELSKEDFPPLLPMF